jgi:hypothetical protein
LIRALPVILSILCMVQTGVAQADPAAELESLKQHFEQGMESPHADDRIEAVTTLVRSGRPEVVGLLRGALKKTLITEQKTHQRYEKLGKKIQESTTPRDHLDKPVANRPKVVKLQTERKLLAALVERDEKVIHALRAGLGRIVAGLPPEEQEAAVSPIVLRLKKARRTEDLVAQVETLGFLKVAKARDAIVPHVLAKAPEVRIAAVEALGRQGDPSCAPVVAKALDDPFWQVRVTAIDALMRVGGKEAVDALVLFLGKAEGRILHDLVEALKKLTGQNFRDNRVLWQNWWTKARDSYRPPRVAKAEEERERRDRARKQEGKKQAWLERGQGTTFYGIQTLSKRIVYILDISNSMNQSLDAPDPRVTRRVIHAPKGQRKIDQAVGELESSITVLDKGATFNIVFYHHEVEVWRKGQVKATPANKRKAIAWAERVVAEGNTNIFDAVDRAFKLAGRGTFDRHYQIAADTFYLLSDGQANRGRVVNPGEMLREVAQLNKFRRVVIHSIALGDSADMDFMARLAGQNGGQFVQFTSAGRK